MPVIRYLPSKSNEIAIEVYKEVQPKPEPIQPLVLVIAAIAGISIIAAIIKMVRK